VFDRCTYPELLEAMGEAQQAERAAFARQLMAVRARYAADPPPF
jgi:hypothetical protein